MTQTNQYTPFDLALYLISSARDCVEEPPIYGPLRLLVGVQRLTSFCETNEGMSDEFLTRTKERLDAAFLLVMKDRSAFVKALDELLQDFSEEEKRRTLGNTG